MAATHEWPSEATRGSLWPGPSSGARAEVLLLLLLVAALCIVYGLQLGNFFVSDDLDMLAKARFWATQARDPAPHYQHSEIGYNYRLSNVLAAIGRIQLEVLEGRVEARRRIFDTYFRELSSIPGISFMPEAAVGRSNRWLTVMLIDPATGVTPADVMKALTERNVESRPVWKPMHLQPVFASSPYFPHREGESVSDELFDRGICLPSGSVMAAVQARPSGCSPRAAISPMSISARSKPSLR